MSEQIVRYEGSLERDDVIAIADQAEKRLAAVLKIKNIALKATNAGDWVDQNGKPYLMASGAEKVAGVFNISWRFLSPEPVKENEPDGNFTYTYRAEFSMGIRTIEAEGSRSSKDKFFIQYSYEGTARIEKPVGDRDNERDVKMAAYTNLLGNGITRILGIRNLTYTDLMEFAGISQDQIGKVEYKKKGERPTIAQPQATGANEATQSVTTGISKVEPRKGKGPYRIIGANNIAYNMFSDTIAAKAMDAQNAGVQVTIEYTKSQYGLDITALTVNEPGSTG